MSVEPALPGLDRLISICQQHSLPLKLSSPRESAPQRGEAVFGQPFDPQLAAVYQRLGAAELGTLTLYGPTSERQGLLPRNEWLREQGSMQFRSSLVFGRETGFVLYYGTVPILADPQGIQPVLHIDGDEGPCAVPVASSVDRFFDAYSRYLELMVVDPEYLHSGISLLHFPWSVPHLIARDEFLLARVRAGQFDDLTGSNEEVHQWLQKLCATP